MALILHGLILQMYHWNVFIDKCFQAHVGCRFHTQSWYYNLLPVYLFTCEMFLKPFFKFPSLSFLFPGVWETCCWHQIHDKHMLTIKVKQLYVLNRFGLFLDFWISEFISFKNMTSLNLHMRIIEHWEKIGKISTSAALMQGTTKIELDHPHGNQGGKVVCPHTHSHRRKEEREGFGWDKVMNGFIKTALAEVWTRMESAAIAWFQQTRTKFATLLKFSIPMQPSLLIYSVWNWHKFKMPPKAFINIQFKTSMTSQITFKKQHWQLRIKSQPHTHTPQPKGDEETAVTPWKKKAMKTRNKGGGEAQNKE